MKRFNVKILFAVVLLTVAAVVLCGCMDRDGGADVGGAGADAPGTTSRGIETTSHSAPNVDGTDGAETEPLPEESVDNSGEEPGEESGEDGADGDIPVITDDIRDLITEKYTKFHSIDGVNIKGYFGEFNGAYAVMIYETGKDYTQAKWDETVDGVKFSYNDGNRILVYDGETFLTLEEAFDKEILTHDDLVAIASRQQNLLTQDGEATR